MRKWIITIICCLTIISITSCNGNSPAEVEGVFSSNGVVSSSEIHTGTISDQQPESESDVAPMTDSEPITQLVVNGRRFSAFAWVDNETLSFIEIEILPDDSERAELAVYNLNGNKLSSIAIGVNPYDHKFSSAYVQFAEDYVYYFISFGPNSYVRINRKTYQIEDCTAKLPASKEIRYDGFYRARYINGLYTASDEIGLFIAPIDDLNAKQYIVKHDIPNKTYYEIYTSEESPYPNKSKTFIYKHEGYPEKFPNLGQGNTGNTTLQLLDFTTNTTLDIAKGEHPSWHRLSINLPLLRYTDQYFVTYRSDYPYDEFVKNFNGTEIYSTKDGNIIAIVDNTLYERQEVDDHYLVSSLNLTTMERTHLLNVKAPGTLLVSPTGDKLVYYNYPDFPNYPNNTDYINVYSLQK